MVYGLLLLYQHYHISQCQSQNHPRLPRLSGSVSQLVCSAAGSHSGFTTLTGSAPQPPTCRGSSWKPKVTCRGGRCWGSHESYAYINILSIYYLYVIYVFSVFYQCILYMYTHIHILICIHINLCIYIDICIDVYITSST